jgi:nondiscriminating glutamyl-tRNA synthetase
MAYSTIRTRFAPSPTGSLHLGNVRTALFNFLFTRRQGGSFLLRSEDTDRERSHEPFLDQLMADLRWLGLDWDHGPDVGGPDGPYRQSEREDIYRSHVDRLLDEDRVYPCWCTVGELAMHRKARLAAGKPPIYDRDWGRFTDKEIDRRRGAGQKPALRFRVPDQSTIGFSDLVRGEQVFRLNTIGDFIIQRSDGSPSFFYGNALDDALMGITHVLRGEDHLSNTPRQLLLLEALDLPIPNYGHLPLLVDSHGSPLSKRKGAVSLAELNKAGLLPVAVNNYIARLGHAFESGDLMSIEQLADHFDIGKVGRTPARYDPVQLEHWQHLALISCTHQEISEWAGNQSLSDVPDDIRERFVELVRANVSRPEELSQWAVRLFGQEFEYSKAVQDELQAVNPGLFHAAADALDGGATNLREVAQAVTAATGLRGRNLFRPLRLALTGTPDGPELGPTIEIMPSDILRRRVIRWSAVAQSTADGEERS